VGEVVLAVILIIVSGAPAAAYPRPGDTERVSVASDGSEATIPGATPPTFTPSHSGAISAEGRYVAFVGWAPTLTPEHHRPGEILRPRIYRHDRVTGTTELVSLNNDGEKSTSGGFRPAISAGGRYVAWHDSSTNLAPGPTNQSTHIYLRDMEEGETVRVSVAPDGSSGDGPGTFNRANSFAPSISADGRFVAFDSRATNLVENDTNGVVDVFVYDRATKRNERVSVASDGTEADATSSGASISADGRFVAFHSAATNLVPDGPESGASHVYVHDREMGTTELVSRTSSGDLGAGGQFGAFGSEISADGRHVAFSSDQTNFVPNPSELEIGAYVHDRETGVTEGISVASDGTKANGRSWVNAISGDGRLVLFDSDASNLVPDDTNNRPDVFLHDRVTGATERVSLAWNGEQGNLASTGSSISADGRFAVFQSSSDNLVPGITNEETDVFVRDRGPVIGPGVWSISEGNERLGVAGWATFSGEPISSATAEGEEISGRRELGAELDGADLVYRHEDESLLARIRLSHLPGLVSGPEVVVSVGDFGDIRVRPQVPAFGPGVVYGMELTVESSNWEVRASYPAPNVFRAALFLCDPICVQASLLSGGFGTTGDEVRVAIPLDALSVTPGAEITELRAYTALGDAATGELAGLDELPLPNARLPEAAVELGIAPPESAESDVTFDAAAELVEGDFSGSLDVSSLLPGDYEMWTRACVDQTCGAALKPVSLGEALVEKIQTILELAVEGRGQDMNLRARLAELDEPQTPVTGRTIDFYSDGELIGSAVTNDGIAAVPVPPGHRGANRTYEAIFEGDDFYRGSSDTRPGRGGGHAGDETGTDQTGWSSRGAVMAR
jgi:Tol biopolymer transport system component